MADVMSVEKRSALMARIRPKNTGLELRVFAALEAAGLSFERHLAVLPRCTPDLVFQRERVVVLVHGDFWHGWRFAAWKAKLSPFWSEKIAINRTRDDKNRRLLKRAGWRVVRVWEHEVEKDLAAVVGRIVRFVSESAGPPKPDRSRRRAALAVGEPLAAIGPIETSRKSTGMPQNRRRLSRGAVGVTTGREAARR